jgi:hypothetical protein
MKQNLLILGLPIVVGLSLTLASCGSPIEREGDLEQPGAVPTEVDGDEDEDEDNEGEGDNN